MPTAKSLKQVQMIKPTRPIQQSPPAKSTQEIKSEIPPIRSALDNWLDAQEQIFGANFRH
jgi:hypothetical protein